MSKQEYVDLEKVSKSVEIMSSIDDMIHYGHLEEYFNDMESLFKDINFEHNNCLRYKEHIDSITLKIQTIKRKVFELTNSLRKMQLSYGGINDYTSDEVKELLKENKLKFTNNMTTSLNDISLEVDSNPVDPLPIAMAIGITGVLGSVGAVVMDNYYTKQEENSKPRELELDSYQEYSFDEEDDGSYRSVSRKDNNTGGVKGSYRAARMENANRSFSEELVEDNYYSDSDE